MSKYNFKDFPNYAIGDIVILLDEDTGLPAKREDGSLMKCKVHDIHLDDRTYDLLYKVEDLPPIYFRHYNEEHIRRLRENGYVVWLE